MQNELNALRKEIEELKAKIRLLEDDCWYDTADLKRILKCSDSKIAGLRKEGIIPFENLGGKFIYPKIYFNTTLVGKAFEKFNKR